MHKRNSASSSSQPVKIPEIPPFKKRDNQHSNYPPFTTSTSQSPQNTTFTTSVSITPPSNLPEIPPYKPRKSSDYTTDIHQQQHQHHQEHRESQDSTASSAVQEHQLTIGPTGGAEWMRRLKVAEQSPIHRSTDCIVSKDLGTSSDSELLKPAPSLVNMSMKSDIPAGTSKILIKLLFIKIL